VVDHRVAQQTRKPRDSRLVFLEIAGLLDGLRQRRLQDLLRDVAVLDAALEKAEETAVTCG
jgi:hypothetical protein